MNRHRSNWSSMSTGRFDLEPGRLDERVSTRQEIIDKTVQEAKGSILDIVKKNAVKDLVRVDSLLWAVYRELLLELHDMGDS